MPESGWPRSASNNSRQLPHFSFGDIRSLWLNAARTMARAEPSQQDFFRSFARLHRILEAAKLLNSTLDINELTRIILRIVRDEVGVDRCTVFIVDRGRNL